MANPVLKSFDEVSEHMHDFGLMMMGRAAYESLFSEMTRPYAHAMAVVTAVNGAEITIKGRIAQEDPSYIFTKTSGPIGIDLFQHGRTIQFSELPKTLLKATGIKIERVEQFQQFGKLRNVIVHSAAPKQDFSLQTNKFLFEVMEPLVQQLWNESLLPYISEWDDVAVSDGYFEEAMAICGIEITPALRKAINVEKS